MLCYQHGGPDVSLTQSDLQQAVISALECYIAGRAVKRVLCIPPDITRLQSYAGPITCICDRYFGDRMPDILPALGTHQPMSPQEISYMYPEVDPNKFRPHRWRSDLVTLGRVAPAYMEQLSDNRLHYDWPAQVNRLLTETNLDLILSIGQVVPHEVIGMANHNKNIFIGTGGSEGINKSHFLGAICGIENILGRSDTPVRRLLDYASQHFARQLPILYLLTVVAVDQQGTVHLRGFFAGDDAECFRKAADLSREVNITMVDRPLKRTVAYLDPHKFRSTWLGNKAIYRSRLAMADGGELMVLAPGVEEFGEDETINALIEQHGYRCSDEVLALMEQDPQLAANPGTAAHLMQGSSDGRFRIGYAAPKLGSKRVRQVGYDYLDLAQLQQLFQIEGKETGWHLDAQGEEFYYIKNPSMGLWAHPQRFQL